MADTPHPELNRDPMPSPRDGDDDGPSPSGYRSTEALPPATDTDNGGSSVDAPDDDDGTPAPMVPLMRHPVRVFAAIYAVFVVVGYFIRAFVFDDWVAIADMQRAPLLPMLVATGGTLLILLATPSFSSLTWTRELAVSIRRILGEPTALQALALGVISGFAEEFLFRGALQPWLGPVAATVIFGLLHAMRGWWIFALIVGAGLAALYEWSGSLWPCVLAHCGINAVNIYRTPRWAAQWEDEFPLQPTP